MGSNVVGRRADDEFEASLLQERRQHLLIAPSPSREPGSDLKTSAYQGNQADDQERPV
jgi:hypothetical protein